MKGRGGRERENERGMGSPCRVDSEGKETACGISKVRPV
jgi:hypothetical protein